MSSFQLSNFWGRTFLGILFAVFCASSVFADDGASPKENGKKSPN